MLPISSFIISSYRLLIKIALWFFLLVALVSGALSGNSLGAHLEWPIICLLVAFVTEIIVFGVALVILDIQTNVREIRENAEAKE